MTRAIRDISLFQFFCTTLVTTATPVGATSSGWDDCYQEPRPGGYTYACSSSTGVTCEEAEEICAESMEGCSEGALRNACGSAGSGISGYCYCEDPE